MTTLFFNWKSFSILTILLLGNFLFLNAQCPTAAGVLTKTHTNVSCFGANDGTITVELGNGGSPLNFELYDNVLGDFVTFSVTETNDPDANGNFRKVTYSNVPPSSYQVVVFKAGCPTIQISEGPTGFVIEEPAVLAITVNSIDPDCNPSSGGANADGSIDVSIAGGRTPYDITWPTATTPISNSTGNTDPTNIVAGSLDGGSYTINVVDASGCSAQMNIDVPIATIPDAGPDQSLCNVTSTTLAANSPGASEVGKWTVVSGTGTFADDTNPATTVSGLTIGASSTFQWTITDDNIPALCPGNSDQVTITSAFPPTTANAGGDQVLCSTNASLSANTPVVGTGLWTIQSGTSGVVTTPTSPTSTFTGTQGTTYVLKWTISNGSCTPSEDLVSITLDANPTAAAAGPDQVVCATNTALAANTPTVGTGTWTIVSGTGGTVTTPSNPTSTFNGTAGQTYVLRWTISNATCPSTQDDVTIQLDESPTNPNAGPNQNICGNSTTLAGNTATIGTGLWSVVSGVGGVFGNASSPTSTFSGVQGTTYLLRWSISNGTCPVETDDVQIRLAAPPTAANAGADQQLCGTSTNLAGNTPVIGTGQWSIISGTGGTIVTPASPTSVFNGVAGNTYVLRWRISNNPCTASSDNVSITFDVPPTTANAGADQNICGTSTALAANTPLTGIGAWTIVSGAGGTIANPSSPTSNFTGTAGVSYELNWTITNGSCPASTDNVQVNFQQAPTTANAGSDQTLCAVTSTNLAANTAVIGTGQWTIQSGTGGSFANASSPTTSFTGTAGVAYVLTWSITNGTCPASTDNVSITFEIAPTTAAAGTDQSICGTSATLAGNTPSTGTGLWTIISGAGGSVTTPSSPTSGFTGTAGVTYVLQWTISNGTCAASSDQVQVQFFAAPTTSAAGADQILCGVTSTNLAANTPVVGTGQWTIISGSGGSVANATSPVSSFTGAFGQSYTLEWTITNGTCTPSIDQVVVTFDEAPTTAAAGPDQDICGTSTALAGNVAAIGSGTWTILSGTGGTITTPSSPTSNFTGTLGQVYVLEWTISNASCPASSDPVQITFYDNPSAASAGTDQNICTLSTTLAANTPAVGTGAWSIQSGTGGVVADAANPASGFTGAAGETYILRWTISNGTCTPTQDEVQIIISNVVTTAAAGSDQTGCEGTSVSLGANAPGAGETGLWTVTSGAGGIFNDPSLPGATFTGNAGVVYTLQWTISNGSCSSSDEVGIEIFAEPTANAGADQNVCGSATLNGNVPSAGTGLWIVSSGAGGSFVDDTDPGTSFSGTAGTTYTLTWTITNGPCSDADDVTISIDGSSPPVADAGADQALCGVTSTTLAGNDPGSASGSWAIISGTGGSFTNNASPTSGFNGVTGQTYVLEWSITNNVVGCVSTTDQVSISFDDVPVADAGPDQSDICGTSTLLFANLPGAGTGVWGIVSGAGGSFADSSDPASTFFGNAGETYVLSWTVTNSCGSTSNQVTIEFDGTLPTPDAGSDQSDICGAATLAAQPPVSGTGTWSITAGAGGNISDPLNPASTFTGTAGVTYTLTWTVVDGSCSASDDVNIHFSTDSPSSPDAGPDQNVCGTSTQLAAVPPASGTASWAIVSGTGGNLSLASDPQATFTGLIGNSYQLRWRVISVCGFLDDFVTINFTDAPVADAGADNVNACGPVTLAGIATNGTGTWSIIAGAGGTLGDPSSLTSTFSGTPGASYTLRLTVSSPSCPDATDDVDISFSIDSPTLADAGPDQNICGTSTTLAANTPAGSETGAWTVVSGIGGSFVDNSLPNTGFSGVDGETYVLEWSISSATPSCSPSADQVTVIFNTGAPIANAGADQQVCGAVAFVDASASTAAGTWSVVSGFGGTFDDNTSATTNFNGVPGNTYTLRYSITSSCGNASDDVEVILDENPTTAVAGPDQFDVCGTAQLEADPVFIGTGVWSIISGTGGVIANVTDPTSNFSGTAGTSYTLRWTASNGTCSDTFDDVVISFDINSPTMANAGPDQSLCGASATLAANTPLGTESGVWTILTGAGGSFVDSTDPATTFNGVAGTSYLIRWTISLAANPSCLTSDDVTIVLEDNPVADAGADQTDCTTSFTLAATTPTSGTGSWSVFSGTGGSFADANDPATTFTGVSGAYVLEWVVTNTCGTSAPDQVSVTILDAPTTAAAGPDQVICGSVVATLAGNTPTIGTGSWVIVSGAGGSVVTPSSPTSQFIGIAGTAYTLRWIIANSTCTPSFDDVDINFAAAPTVTSPVTVCQNTAAAALTATATGAISFNWYYYTDPTDVTTKTLLPTTTASHTPGAELNTAVVGSLTYEVEAVYACGSSNGSQIVVNVSNTGSCGNGGTGCFAFIITPDDALTKRPTCSNQDDGFLAVDVSGYSGKYEVSIWTGGVRLAFHVDFARKFTFPNLSPALYELHVEDELGNICIREFDLPVQTTVIATSTTITNSPCFGQPNGVAVLNVTGGNSPYDYSIDGGATWNPNYVSGNEIADLPVGTYNILVRDDETDLCPAEVPITIENQFDEITYDIASAAVSNCNASDGSITVSNIAGGSGTKQVRLLQITGAGNVVVQDFADAGASVVFDNRPQGSYIIEIRDETGCVVSNELSPSVITAPGAVIFDVTKIADADCTKQGKSGVVRIQFTSGGTYLIGISRSQVIEPETYVTYTYNDGDQPIFVDTLSRGNYFVFVKPQSGSACASTKPTGEIEGAYAISFDVQRVCSAETNPSVNLVNVIGQPGAQMTIEVYRASDLSNPVEQFTVMTAEQISITYQGEPAGTPHTWLIQEDDYIIKAYQNQAFCPGEKEPSYQVQYSVTQPMLLTIENIKQSLPEPRHTGGFTLRTITGGSPFRDEDRPYFLATLYDPSSNTPIIDPVKVYRNSQGNFQYEFRNYPVGNYLLEVTDTNGCEVATLVIVPADTRLLIPNIFTPNNDLINDQFEIVNLPEGGSHKLVITNRWGKEIYSSGDYREGKFWAAEGEPDGIYFYRLQVQGDQTYTGWVEVLRGDKP
jgi:gliding motility-associated-like protein